MLKEPDKKTDKKTRQRIWLVNLGSPERPEKTAVKRYLKRFLSDPRVIKNTGFLWNMLLNAVILPLRSGKVAEKYRQIWLPEGAPLAVYTRRLTEKLAARHPERKFDHAMVYGEPSLQRRLAESDWKAGDELLVVAMYPQYSRTTFDPIRDQIEAHFAAKPHQPRPTIRYVQDYSTHPFYIKALADSVREHWQQHGRGQKLLLSFHGLPQEYIAAGDPYTQAKQHLKQALHVNPEGLEARLHLDDIRIEEGQIEQALSDLTQLEEQHPDNTAVKLMIGKGLYEKRNWAGAERYFDKVLAMEPGDALARYYKALSQLWSGNLQAAADEIKAFVSKFPETRESFIALGNTAFVEKQYPLAAKYLSEVVKKNAPTSVKLTLGQALSKMGQWPDARFWLLQALESRPEDSEAKVALAETYEYQGRPDKALEAYGTISEGDSRYLSALLGQARSYLASGQPQPAEATADKVLGLMPNHAEAMLLKLWSLFAQDKLADAELFLLTIPFDKFNDKARAPLLQSKALLEDRQQQFDQAWETFVQVPPLRRVPKYPELNEEEVKTIQSWPEEAEGNHKIPTFVLGYDSTDIQTFALWLKAQGLEVLNDRLAGLGRPDIFYALQKTADLDALGKETIANERTVYWDHIKPWLGGEDRDVVDFMFLNPHQAKLIKRFFPEARVVVLQRNSPDIWLHQHAFGVEPVEAKDWTRTVNQLIGMGLNVEQVNTDKWLAGDEATLKHLQSIFNKPLEKPVLRDVPWWRTSRFEEGHWKNYAKHLSENAGSNKTAGAAGQSGDSEPPAKGD